jgi:glycosyltransferase involved in cell wall biosynthesis/tRNA A-37 threonylcarbamoyl transferase component Bud32
VFEQQGEVIYDARNQIRRMTVEDHPLVVKRFHAPALLNRIAYSSVRKPKAERAYRNAKTLQEKGIATPEPVAYILCGEGLLHESYLVTLASTLRHTFYDFRDGVIAGKEDLIRAFAQYAARLHNAGVLHKDFSPGNILYDRVNGKWQFELVDLNRLSFGSVSPKEGCCNLCRLWGKTDFFEVLAPAYAQARGIDEAQCLRWIQTARKQFWKHHAHEHFVTDDTFSVGVIISTYNKPEWLEKVFWGLMAQTHPANEIIIADDGSDERTARLISRYADRLPLRHVWHEDKGFRKTEILNLAVQEATSEYLIFMDQDLIPRRDFISQHYRHAQRDRFVSGGAILLPKALSEALTQDDIRSGNAFSIRWLEQHGMPWHWKMSKLWRNDCLCAMMNHLTPAKASWNGGNASTWRQSILNANGFDTRMRYGAEDREFGQRLENAGIRGIQLRYGTPLLHLYHERPYRNEEDLAMNITIWRETRKNKLTRTAYGIE